MLDKNLKTKREEKGYSKMELAKLSGVARRTIEFIEYKKVSPTLKTLEALAKALDTNVEDLIK